MQKGKAVYWTGLFLLQSVSTKHSFLNIAFVKQQKIICCKLDQVASLFQCAVNLMLSRAEETTLPAIYNKSVQW